MILSPWSEGAPLPEHLDVFLNSEALQTHLLVFFFFLNRGLAWLVKNLPAMQETLV